MERYKSLFKKELKEGFHGSDNLLEGITFKELIDTVESNEKVINEQTVNKVYNEILKIKLEDSKSELKSNMKNIIKTLNSGGLNF